MQLQDLVETVDSDMPVSGIMWRAAMKVLYAPSWAILRDPNKLPLTEEDADILDAMDGTGEVRWWLDSDQVDLTDDERVDAIVEALLDLADVRAVRPDPVSRIRISRRLPKTLGSRSLLWRPRVVQARGSAGDLEDQQGSGKSTVKYVV